MDVKPEGHIVGVDIGGTDIKLVLMDGGEEPVECRKIDTGASKGPDHALGRLASAVKSMLTDYNISPNGLSALGVGSAGPLDLERGSVYHAPNLAGWEGASITDSLSHELKTPVFLENDANLAAYGEYVMGAGKGTDLMICLTLGTGIGGGIIIDGQIFNGALGPGAEPGHMVVDMSGPLCKCGNRGCLESEASASAVARMGAEAIQEGRGSIILQSAGGDVGKVNAETVHRAALKGDGSAVEILHRAGRSLGVGIANLVNIFAPQAVIVGGGLMNSGDFILRPARETALNLAFPFFTRGLAIVPAELGDWAGAMGAAFYAKRKMSRS